jgi:hypothetical protein
MKHMLPLICLASLACTVTRAPIRYAPPEEAAWFKLPRELPTQGREVLPGPMAAAIQLAMEDFLPWGSRPPKGATPREACLHQRQAYDIHASPGGDGIMLVRISTHAGVCQWGGDPVTDMGATYAVDTRNWRILAIRRP